MEHIVKKQNDMGSYYNKYIKYKTKYLQLKHIKLNQEGGNYDYTDSKEMIKYLNCIINGLQCDGIPNEKTESNEKPYLLILYGPPASGKTSAIEQITKYLNLSSNNINIDVDKFVYDTKQWKDFTKLLEDDKIKNISYDKLDDDPIIQNIAKQYKNIRSRTSFMINILVGIALMYNYNVVMEMSGRGLEWYMTHIINEFIHYKYNVHIVYPYTDNVNMLYNRSIKRGYEEYRFVSKKFIDEVYVMAKKNFLKILDKKDNYTSILVYDINNTKINDNILFEYNNNKIIYEADTFIKKLLDS
jgi:GTPase SAR1 family protein